MSSRPARCFSTFADEVPLRMSALPYLIRCPLRAVLLHLELLTDEGGKAAQTGSMIHEGVETFHAFGEGAAIDAILASVDRFPLGDVETAQRHFEAYAADPRNKEAEIVALERQVDFALDPSSDDPNGRPIRLQGTLDQVRREHGRLWLYDVKTGKPSGWDMVNEYAYQVAGYCAAASEMFDEDVHPGAIIRTQGYFRRKPVDPRDAPDGVFFKFPYTLDDCRDLLDHVRTIVALIRRGQAFPSPGSQCNWCPAGGLEGCLPERAKLC